MGWGLGRSALGFPGCWEREEMGWDKMVFVRAGEKRKVVELWYSRGVIGGGGNYWRAVSMWMWVWR